MLFLRTLVLSVLCITGSLSALTPKPNLQLVPFNEIKHGKQARKVYQGAFRNYGLPAAINPQAQYHYGTSEKVLVLIQGNTVIGVIIYCDYQQYHDYPVKNSTVRYVNWLAVDPALHSKGYGSIFMKKFEQKSLEENVIEITLSPLQRAKPFYKRLGFIGVGGQMMKSLKLHDNNPVIQIA